MKTRKIQVKNKTGLHARPATDLAELASTFQADIRLSYGEKCKSAKSVIGILSLGVHAGSIVNVTADGKDEEAAISAITRLAEANFNEKE